MPRTFDRAPFFAGTLAAGVALACLGWTGYDRDVLRVAGLEVVDDEGRVRIRLGVQEETSVVELLGVDGRSTLTLTTSDHGTVVMAQVGDAAASGFQALRARAGDPAKASMFAVVDGASAAVVSDGQDAGLSLAGGTRRRTASLHAGPHGGALWLDGEEAARSGPRPGRP